MIRRFAVGAIAMVVPMQCADPVPVSPTNCDRDHRTTFGSVGCDPGPFNGTTQFRAAQVFFDPYSGGYGTAYGEWIVCCDGDRSYAYVPGYIVARGGYAVGDPVVHVR